MAFGFYPQDNYIIPCALMHKGHTRAQEQYVQLQCGRMLGGRIRRGGESAAQNESGGEWPETGNCEIMFFFLLKLSGCIKVGRKTKL
jgi:hypothetical protein